VYIRSSLLWSSIFHVMPFECLHMLIWKINHHFKSSCAIGTEVIGWSYQFLLILWDKSSILCKVNWVSQWHRWKNITIIQVISSTNTLCPFDYKLCSTFYYVISFEGVLSIVYVSMGSRLPFENLEALLQLHLAVFHSDNAYNTKCLILCGHETCYAVNTMKYNYEIYLLELKETTQPNNFLKKSVCSYSMMMIMFILANFMRLICFSSHISAAHT